MTVTSKSSASKTPPQALRPEATSEDPSSSIKEKTIQQPILEPKAHKMDAILKGSFKTDIGLLKSLSKPKEDLLEKNSKETANPSFKEVLEKPAMSWADICDELSDEEQLQAFASITNLIDDKKVEESSSNTVMVPGGMEEFMPRWKNIIDLAARVAGLQVVESTLQVEGVIAQGLYSLDAETYRVAKETARANQRDVYMAFNTVNQIFSFFSKPIDLKKGDIGVGQGFVLDKMCLEWNKHALGDHFDESRYRSGSKWHSLRPVLKKRVQALLTKGEVKDVAELFVSALDFIVYRYVKRIYSSTRSSEYLTSVVKLCTSNAQQIISANLRKVKSKVSETQGSGKTKKTIEKVKLSLIKPWVRKSEAWTPKEQACVKVMNEALTDDLADTLKLISAGGPVFNGSVGSKLMQTAWDLVDSFHEIEGLRRKHVRQLVISKRAEDKKKEKIKPDEWSLQMQAAIEESSRDGAKLKAYVETHGLEMKDGIITRASVRSRLEKILEDAEATFEEVQIDFDELNIVGSDPEAYHKKLYQESIVDEVDEE